MPKLLELTDLNFYMVDDLLNESKAGGYNFIQRTIDDWNSGANKFSKQGEKLFGLVTETGLIAICGLNQDPYSEEVNTGRVRHLYVLEAHRRKGYAYILVNAIIKEARNHFTTLTLFTDSLAASKFYEVSGFEKVDLTKVTHRLCL